MILKQYYLGCLAHASYLLADEASSTAIIVHPQRDIQQYLADAEKSGLQIRHVFLTHFHADFVAGHLELRARCGATIHLGSRAQAEYAFVAMKDGDALSFPGLRLQVLETPGHTIESISILVFDLHKDPAQPYAVLTGDTLFIGDVGRPALRASLGWSANDLGSHLYHSLHNKLLKLPDSTTCKSASPKFRATAAFALHCAGGYRSSIAASILQQYGITNLAEMAGVLAAWKPRNCPWFRK